MANKLILVTVKLRAQIFRESNNMSKKSFALYIQLLSNFAFAHDATLETCRAEGPKNAYVEIFSTFVSVTCNEQELISFPISESDMDTPCERFLEFCSNSTTTEEALPVAPVSNRIFPDEIVDVQARVNVPMASSASKDGDRISIICSNKETKRKMEFVLRGTVVDRIADPIAVQKLCDDFFGNEQSNQPIMPVPEMVPVLAEEPTTTTTTTTTTPTPTTTTTEPTTELTHVPSYSRPRPPRPVTRPPRSQPRPVRREPRVPNPRPYASQPRRPVRKVRIVVDVHGAQQGYARPHYHAHSFAGLMRASKCFSFILYEHLDISDYTIY